MSTRRPTEPPSTASTAVPVVRGGDGSSLRQTLRERVEHILSLIRPAVQSDGGDLELVNVSSEGVVQVRLHGACVGCPSSTMTLQAGIERNLKQHIPEVTGVVAVA